MYPTIIIVLVNSQRSMVDTYGFGSAFRSRASGHPPSGVRSAHLSFALPPIRSVPDVGYQGVQDTREGRIVEKAQVPGASEEDVLGQTTNWWVKSTGSDILHIDR